MHGSQAFKQTSIVGRLFVFVLLSMWDNAKSEDAMRVAFLVLMVTAAPIPAVACLQAEFMLDFDGDGMNEKVHIDSCYDLWPEVDNGRLSISFFNEDTGAGDEVHFYGGEGEELGYGYYVLGLNRHALVLSRMQTCAAIYYWNGEWDATPFNSLSLCD